MDYKIDDFIGVFNQAISADSCEKLINTFEETANLNFVQDRVHSENVKRIHKDNKTVFVHQDEIPNEILFASALNETAAFVRSSWECYKLYAEQYGILDSIGKHMFYHDIKIQKNLPGQGYHIWHCEHERRYTGSRLLLVIGYLNDVTSGGETEFLYQSKRIQPQQGTIIICPAYFTHTHRGNPPLAGAKYIINGWMEFAE
jgi:hypothetical protein